MEIPALLRNLPSLMARARVKEDQKKAPKVVAKVVAKEVAKVAVEKEKERGEKESAAFR